MISALSSSQCSHSQLNLFQKSIHALNLALLHILSNHSLSNKPHTNSRSVLSYRLKHLIRSHLFCNPNLTPSPNNRIIPINCLLLPNKCLSIQPSRPLSMTDSCFHSPLTECGCPNLR